MFSWLKRKKKQTVKQVLWVKINSGSMGVSSIFVPDDTATQPFKNDRYGEWHKVPTCTREIEV